jgi:hypothetical protein
VTVHDLVRQVIDDLYGEHEQGSCPNSTCFDDDDEGEDDLPPKLECKICEEMDAVDKAIDAAVKAVEDRDHYRNVLKGIFTAYAVRSDTTSADVVYTIKAMCPEIAAEFEVTP